jgi:hypothetical protein
VRTSRITVPDCAWSIVPVVHTHTWRCTQPMCHHGLAHLRCRNRWNCFRRDCQAPKFPLKFVPNRTFECGGSATWQLTLRPLSVYAGPSSLLLQTHLTHRRVSPTFPLGRSKQMPGSNMDPQGRPNPRSPPPTDDVEPTSQQLIPESGLSYGALGGY